MRRSARGAGDDFGLGDAQLPGDFPERLLAIKQRGDLTWDEMADALGVDTRQLLRWRRGACPNGGAMLSLVRLAAQVPGGMSELIGDKLTSRQLSMG